MQTLQTLLPFPSFLPPKPKTLTPSKSQKPTPSFSPRHPLFLPKNRPPPNNLLTNVTRSDEFPVDETFLQNFAPKEKETEDEARRINWVERGWAPWEEILSPEADFARKSLNEGEEVPLKTPEAIEAFKMLNPKYRKKKMEESGLTEDEWYCQITN